MSQQKLSSRQVRWVEVLAGYAANFVYKAGHIHSAPDALSRIPIFNTVDRPQPLLEAVRQAQNVSNDKDFLHFKYLVDNPTSDSSLNQGILIKLCWDSSPIIIPKDTRQFYQTILEELHTLPLGGHLGYRKILEFVRSCFWCPHFNSPVQEFCHQCVLY